MSVCAGGLFGNGETMDLVLELALELKALNVDAVPVNFFARSKEHLWKGKIISLL